MNNNQNKNFHHYNSAFISGSEVQKIFIDNIREVVNLVASTLGPKGYLSLIDAGMGKIRYTKDGVSVMRSIATEDRFNSMFIESMKEICNKTNSKVGDGTTTTLVLFHAMAEEIYKLITLKYSHKKITNILNIIHSEISTIIQTQLTLKCDDYAIKSVAKISSNDEKLGELVYTTLSKIDAKYGNISVMDDKSSETTSEITSGMTIQSGYYSPHFINNKYHNNVELEDTVIYIIRGNITKQQVIVNFLEYLGMTHKPGVIFITGNIDKTSLGSCIFNVMQGIVKACIVKVSNEELEDLAIFNGAQIIETANRENITFNTEALGSCNKIIITNNKTTIIGGQANEEVKEKYLNYIKNAINNEKDANNKEKLKERYSKIVGTSAVIKVGASTSIEINEIKDRIVDSVCAVKAAIDGGVSIGGGITFIQAYKAFKQSITFNQLNEEDKIICNILIESLLYPASKILINGGFEYKSILNQLKNCDKNFGFDLFKEEIVDFHKNGILDPTNVILSALDGAISLSKLFTNLYSIIPKPIIKDATHNNLPAY